MDHNNDLLSNEPKMVYWFTTALAYIQHQLAKTIDVHPDDEGSLNEKPVSFLVVDLKRVCDTEEWELWGFELLW